MLPMKEEMTHTIKLPLEPEPNNEPKSKSKKVQETLFVMTMKWNLQMRKEQTYIS